MKTALSPAEGLRLREDVANLIAWDVEGRPLTVRYSLRLIEDLVALTMSGYERSPWGGVEVGGVLFGKKEPGGVHIHTFRAMECEHRHGPSFELSERDLERLDRLLAGADTDEGLRDLVPVGWYYSVSQRELYLTEAALAVLDRSFREPWQLTLVLKRSKKDPADIGFFFRENNGSMQARTPYRFSLDELRALVPAQGSSEGEAATEIPESPPAIEHPAPNESRPFRVPAPLRIVESEISSFASGLQESLPAVERSAPNESGSFRVPEPLRILESELPSFASALPEDRPVIEHPAPDQSERFGVREPLLIPESKLSSFAAALPASPFSFFELDQDPFPLTPDTSIFYPSPEHKEAIASLFYGIQARKGFLALIGEAGTGKTIVLECVINELNRQTVDFAYLCHSKITTGQFFEFLNYDLDLGCSPATKTSVLIALNERLVDRFQQGWNTALIVDNAQKLPLDVLEEIELIGNLETRRGKPLQVVFAGQPSFERLLERPELRGLRQRILLRARLGPLSAAQTADYIGTRLAIAGLACQAIFSPDLLAEIHLRTRGIPRLINALCGGILSACRERKTKTADQYMIEEVSSNLELTNLCTTDESDDQA